jgi:hypothetical protein
VLFIVFECTTSLKTFLTSGSSKFCAAANASQSVGLMTDFFICSHNWAHVNVGLGYKYPNPHCSHVITVDVLSREIDPKTGIIRTERVLGCKQKAPIWIVKVKNFKQIVLRVSLASINPASWWIRGCLCS